MADTSTESNRNPNLLLVGIRRGLGLGLVFTMVEAAAAIPFFIKFKQQQSLAITMVTIGFCLALGALLGLLATPLLRLRRGQMWHAACAMVLLAAVVLAVPPHFDFRRSFDVKVLAVVAVVFALSLWLTRRPIRARITVALGVVLVIISHSLPTLVAARQAAATPESATRKAPPRGAPNVLLIVLDTVRADRLELMGHDRETFPWLTAFAREGATFRRALSAAPWTLPSHASMFTGLYPSGHGAHHEGQRLDASHTTLAEILYHHGWETVALNASFNVSEPRGLTQGFTTVKPLWMAPFAINYSFAYRLGSKLGLVAVDHGGQLVTDEWRRWLDEWQGERPFFAFLNYFETHLPYHQIPGDRLTTFTAEQVGRREVVAAAQAVLRRIFLGEPISEETLQIFRDLYDAGLLYENGLVAEAVAALRARGVLDQTIVVVVSDHGDLHGEHDMFNHTRSLWDYLLAVPLVIRYPGQVPAGLVVETPVTTAALLPTILDLADLPAAENIHTRSFAPLFTGDEARSRSPLLAEQYRCKRGMEAETPLRNVFDRFGVRYRSLEEDGWKLIVDCQGSRWLFRPRDDPAESRNLIEDFPEVAARLTANLASMVEAYDLGALDRDLDLPATDLGLDAQEREQLRALGYSDE
jgi:arylsulfatase A-like enzyme